MLPNFLILDTQNEVDGLRSGIGKLLEFNISEKIIMPIIFNLCVDEKIAELELTHECMAMANGSLGEIYGNDIETLADAMITFGTLMFKKLQEVGAYQDGHLPFKYAAMLGKDIVLIANTEDNGILVCKDNQNGATKQDYSKTATLNNAAGWLIMWKSKQWDLKV